MKSVQLRTRQVIQLPMQPNQYYLIILPFGEVQAHLLIRCNPVTNLPTFSHSMGCNLRTRNGMFTCVCKGMFCLYSEAIILIIKCFFRSSIVRALLTIGVKSLFFLQALAQDLIFKPYPSHPPNFVSELQPPSKLLHQKVISASYT